MKENRLKYFTPLTLTLFSRLCCLLCLFLLCSCKLSHEERKYVDIWQNKGSHINYHLTLKRNGSYIYNIKCFCPKFISYGTWHLTNDTLVLIQKHYQTSDPNDPQYEKKDKDTLFKKLVLRPYNFDKNFSPKKDYLQEINNGREGSVYMK